MSVEKAAELIAAAHHAVALTGANNSALGNSALYDIQGGATANTALGMSALEWNSGGGWNTALIDKLGLPRSVFPRLVDPGSRIGVLSESVMAEIG